MRKANIAFSARSPAKKRSRNPRVWLLMGSRAGDNNQLLALAEALDCPYDAKKLDFNQLRRLPFLRHGLTIVAGNSRALIAPPWPDMVIGVGYGSVPVARYIREQAGGRVKLVHIGNPREKLDDFDLQITTPQYARSAAPNLLELPFTIGNPAKAAEPTPDELAWLDAFPRPRRLIAVGGKARHWKLDHDALARAIRTIADKQPRGSLIVATSARTTPKTRDLLARLVGGQSQALVDQFPSFATLLAMSDEIHVTADSVSMLSEAVLSGKPAGMIPIRRSLKGQLAHWLWEKPLNSATFPNFPNFWDLLRRHYLIGTAELPVAAQVCDTVGIAAAAVRSMLAPGDVIDGSEAERAYPHLGTARRTRRRQQSGDRTGGSALLAVRDQGARL